MYIGAQSSIVSLIIWTTTWDSARNWLAVWMTSEDNFEPSNAEVQTVPDYGLGTVRRAHKNK